MKPVIFDFDGTLANSGPIIIECFGLTLKEEQGKEYPPEFYKPFIGPPLEETFARLGAEDPVRHITTYRRHYFQRMYATLLFDGVGAMLEHLDEVGMPMAIATSKRHFADLFGQNGHICQFAEVADTVCLYPFVYFFLGFFQGHNCCWFMMISLMFGACLSLFEELYRLFHQGFTLYFWCPYI